MVISASQVVLELVLNEWLRSRLVHNCYLHHCHCILHRRQDYTCYVAAVVIVAAEMVGVVLAMLHLVGWCTSWVDILQILDR